MTAPEPERLRPTQGRVPPSDLDAEGAVLSACILQQSCIDKVIGIGLRELHFYSDRNRLLFAGIEKLHAEGEPVDAVTLASLLGKQEQLARCGGIQYIAMICDATPAVANVEFHARIVRQHGRRRQMIAQLQAHAAAGYGDVVDTQAWFEQIETDVGTIARQDAENAPQTIGKAAGAAFDRLVEAARLGKPAGLPSGFERFDNMTTGMHGARLYVVAGRPGMGKTAWALNVATQIAAPKREMVTEDQQSREIEVPGDGVVFFSLEMDSEALAMRAMCSDQRLDGHLLERGVIRPDDWGKLTNGVAWLAKLPLWIDDNARTTLAELRSRSRKLKIDIERGQASVPCRKLRLIVVDYLQLIWGERRFGVSREEFVAECARGLKALSKELSVPVLALAQLNRECERRPDKRPMLSDLRESGAIEQEADLIGFLYRDEIYDKESQDKGIAELIIAKQRGGPTGTIKLKYTPQYTRFDNLAPEDYDFDDEFDSD